MNKIAEKIYEKSSEIFQTYNRINCGVNAKFERLEELLAEEDKLYDELLETTKDPLKLFSIDKREIEEIENEQVLVQVFSNYTADKFIDRRIYNKLKEKKYQHQFDIYVREGESEVLTEPMYAFSEANQLSRLVPFMKKGYRSELFNLIFINPLIEKLYLLDSKFQNLFDGQYYNQYLDLDDYIKYQADSNNLYKVYLYIVDQGNKKEIDGFNLEVVKLYLKLFDDNSLSMICDGISNKKSAVIKKIMATTNHPKSN